MRLIPAPQVVEDLRLGRGVQRGEWFVEQEHAGVSHQRSRQRDALAFSAGDFRWALLAQVIDAELLQHRRGPLLARWARQMRESIFSVLLDREVREQCEILQDVSHGALRHWKIAARVFVSNKARSPTAIRPASGVASPATQSSSVVLPDPDAPNRMVNPGAAVKSTSRENSRSV